MSTTAEPTTTGPGGLGSAAPVHCPFTGATDVEALHAGGVPLTTAAGPPVANVTNLAPTSSSTTDTATPTSAPTAAGGTIAPAAAQGFSTGEPSPGQVPPAPPEDLTLYYDPLSYAAYDYSFDLYRRLRDHAPVYYNERRKLYIISRYADVLAVLDDAQTFVNALGNDIDGTHASYDLDGNLIAQDDPRHAVLRSAVRRTFIGRELLAKEQGLREFGSRLWAEFKAKGQGDFVTEFALPFVFATSMNLLGMPNSEAPYYTDHLLRSMARTVGLFGIPEDAAASNRESEEHLLEIIEQRRHDIAAGTSSLGSDVISQILTQTPGKLGENEGLGLAHLVLSASTDAPAALMSNCMFMLERYPALQAHLARRPEMIKPFIEETLRFEAPAQNLSRQSTAEVTIAGVTIPADSRVMVLMGSANRDERVFPDPDRFDITREFTKSNRILSFGDGIHACLGAPLARLATQVALETLLADGTQFRVVGTPERWIKQMIRGFASLPIAFKPTDQP